MVHYHSSVQATLLAHGLGLSPGLGTGLWAWHHHCEHCVHFRFSSESQFIRISMFVLDEGRISELGLIGCWLPHAGYKFCCSDGAKYWCDYWCSGFFFIHGVFGHHVVISIFYRSLCVCVHMHETICHVWFASFTPAREQLLLTQWTRWGQE